MKRLLRWLNPNSFLRGLRFGYLFGLVGWVVMVTAFILKSSNPTDAFWRDLKLIPPGFLWAIPWAVLWSMSGAMCRGVPGYPATVLTLIGIAAGTAYSLTTGTWGGWQIITIPFQSAVATFLVHLPAIGVVALLRLNAD
jgi:hypothetical protein